MSRSILLLAATVGLAACNQPADQAANNVSANAASGAPKKAGFCFFKPEEMKGWKAAVDAAGAIRVTGKAHVKDSRYVAQLGEPEIDGSKASVALSIAQNSGTYGATDDWWDVKAEIPANPALQAVSVTCGGKSVADLPLKKG
jgi:hypothetical protein